MSWNLNGNPDLLTRGLMFLAEQPCAVGAFQEVPVPLTQESLARIGVAHRLTVHHQMVAPLYWRNLTIVSTAGLRSAMPREDPEKKLAAVSIMFPGLGLVDVVVVHAISKATEANERQRFKRAALLRRSLNAVWRLPKLIVLGDFNAEPFDAEIWDDEAFHAVRDRGLIRFSRADGDYHGRPLLNLSWNWLAESPARGAPGGSFRFDRVSRHSDWCSFDQIIVSEPLIEYVGGYRVLTDLKGVLVGGCADARTIAVGDHLPVLVEIRPERWNLL